MQQIILTTRRVRYAVFVTAVLSGCVMQPAAEDAPPADAEPPVEDAEPAAAEDDDASPVGDAIAVVQPPGYCELLLENLERTRPLLAGLDASLAEHVERMEELVAELESPDPEQAPLDCPTDPDSILGAKEVIGTIEWIYMTPPGQHYRARVDSGAETSSLSAREIAEFERDGEDWVRFVFEHETAEDAVELELPIVRTIMIRQPATDELDRRVVVEMDIRLGDRLQRTEFALTDRSQMTYPVLLGRAFIRDLYVIDVARSYTQPRYEAP